LKVAASIDGRTALDNGNSQWITSDAARADGHAWRARACTILTGIGTVRHDNPRLDVRLVETLRQPAIAIVDSTLQTPLDAPLFIACRACCIYAAERNDARQEALEARGANVVYLPDRHGRVDLPAMLADLAQRQTNELHVEAGARLNGALVQANLVDEYLVYLAPTIIGSGPGMAQFGPLTDLAQARRLDFRSFERLGMDMRVLARPLGDDRF
jgi:diaminohydroxyphosphoribosylaminopyrimidine deaminase/5-amino-6-(5-phosphoribosylamino)uracil reductase